MIVVIANDLPPAVRGRMKLWFIEPKPNVFVSGVKDGIARQVIDYLFEFCPIESGLAVIHSIHEPPWYAIRSLGDVTKPKITLSGLELILEKGLE